MASSTEYKEDMIKCSICLEVLKVPKCLPCLHTFCEACLISYFTSVNKDKIDTDSSSNFSCPICRSTITTPYISPNPKQWVAELPNNDMVLSLMDQQQIQSKKKNCDWCKVEDIEIIAFFWCIDCNEALCDGCCKTHKKINHELIRLDEFESNPPRINIMKYCKEHSDKKLEIFCTNHQIPCCLTCMKVHHRKCDNVITLEEAAKNVCEKPEMTTLIEQLKDASTVFEKIAREKQLNIQDLGEQKRKYETIVRDTKEKIYKHIDKLESKFNEELNGLHKQYTTQLTEEREEFENMKETIDSYINILDTVKSKATESYVFLEMLNIRRLIEQQQENIQQRIQEAKHIEYTIEVDKLAASLTATLDKLADICVKSTSSEIVALFPKESSEVKLANCVVKKTELFSLQNNHPGSDYKDVEFINGDKFCITDWKGNTLRVHTEDGTLVSEMTLSGNVHCVTLISDNEVAVTRPSQNAIDIVNVNTMTRSRELKVLEKCFGIAFFDEKLVLACKSCILFLDKDGKQLSRRPVTPCIDYIAKVSHDRLCYTNHQTNNVYCLEKGGTEVFSYNHSNLKTPYGATADHQGNIYVAGHSSHNIHQLAPNGQMIQIIIGNDPDMNNPRGIAFKQKSNKLLICHNTSKVTMYEMVHP